MATADDLLAAIGYGRISASQVAHKLLPPNILEAHKQQPKTVAEHAPRRREEGVKVQGLNDILIHYAQCCHPLPGDSIVGYVTRGRGITVHTMDCLSAEKLEYDADRRVPVEWDLQQGTTHPVKISVVALDQAGVLAGVSSAIADCDGNISRATVTTSQEKRAYLDFTVDIRDITHLKEVMRRVSNLNGVLSVERVKNGRRRKWPTG